MDIKKLAPWNWFKNEEEEEQQSLVPVERRHLRTRTGQNIYDPLQAFNELDRIFENALDETRWPPFSLHHFLTPLTDSGMLRPHVDISASTKEYTITVEVPGVSENDIALEISEDTLIIKGEKKQKQEDRSENYYRMERSYGSFRRMLSLPEDAKQENIKASFKHGILTITIPRKEPSPSQIRNIEIKALE